MDVMAYIMSWKRTFWGLGTERTHATIGVTLFCFLVCPMTELLNPKSSETGHFLPDSRSIPRPWDFSSGQQYYFSPNQFLREILSS